MKKKMQLRRFIHSSWATAVYLPKNEEEEEKEKEEEKKKKKASERKKTDRGLVKRKRNETRKQRGVKMKKKR